MRRVVVASGLSVRAEKTHDENAFVVATCQKDCVQRFSIARLEQSVHIICTMMAAIIYIAERRDWRGRWRSRK